MRETPEIIMKLNHDEVFVFGSNEGGYHGAGAARQAMEKWGARLYQGFGMTSSNTFAIPTKDWEIGSLSLNVIATYVDRYVAYVDLRTDRKFLTTSIGCGLAGYLAEEIAPLFIKGVDLPNLYLPKQFWQILKQII